MVFALAVGIFQGQWQAMLLCGFVLFILMLFFATISDGIGFGDVKLAALSGMMVGHIQYAVGTFALSWLLASVIVYKKDTKETREAHVGFPLGTTICAATFVAISVLYTQTVYK